MANYRMNKIAIGSDTYECAEWYGVCSTAASTKDKTVSISGFTSAQLVEGCRVTVRFVYQQTYDGNNPTLNVSSTGAKTISTADGYGSTVYEWIGGAILTFVYANSRWIIENGEHASIYAYGKAMLTNQISNNQAKALTPKAVYDAGYATTSQIPTKVSDLDNDSGFLTLSTLPVWDGSVT